MITRPITIRLDASDYERLEGEAMNLGMRPGSLAKVLLHSTLANSGAAVVGSMGGRLAALDRLLALSKGKPTVDALALVRQARQDIGETAP